MKRKLIFLLCLLLLCFASAAAAQNLEKLGSTTSGDLYIDKDNIQPLTHDGRLFLLVQAELHYNEETLPKLQSLHPELRTAVEVTQIYMYNNDGTQYALLKSLYTDKNDKVVYSVDGTPELKPVQSRLQMLLYEKALSQLEEQKRIADMLKRKY